MGKENGQKNYIKRYRTPSFQDVNLTENGFKMLDKKEGEVCICHFLPYLSFTRVEKKDDLWERNAVIHCRI